MIMMLNKYTVCLSFMIIDAEKECSLSMIYIYDNGAE